MEVTNVSSMPCGTKIQIEDWSEDYKFFSPSSTLAAYPKSKVSKGGQFGPNLNKTLRVSFNFDSKTETMQAFKGLEVGIKQLSDFIEKINNPEKIECI